MTIQSMEDSPDRSKSSMKGPTRKRHCTNLFFLFLFMTFLAGWLVISLYAVQYADPEKVLSPTDSYGRICGRNELSGKPYLFFFNILKCAKLGSLQRGCNTPQICVEQCPDFTRSYSKFKDDRAFNGLPYTEKSDMVSKLICDYNVTLSAANMAEIPRLLRTHRCASIYFKGSAFTGRCIPTALKRLRSNTSVIADDLNSKMTDDENRGIKVGAIRELSEGIALVMNATTVGEKIVDDLVATWPYILSWLFIAMLVSFLWIVLLRLVAGTMIWLSIVAIVLLSGLTTHICVNQYQYLNTLSPAELDELETERLDEKLDIDLTSIIKVQLDSFLSSKRVWLGLAIVSGIVCFILTLTLVFLRKRVQVSIALIKEASKAVAHAKFSLIFPIFPYIFQITVVVFVLFNAILIAALGKNTYRFNGGPKSGLPCNPFAPNSSESVLPPDFRLDIDGIRSNMTNGTGDCVKYQYFNDNVLTYAHLYNLFGLLWMLFFISGVCKVIFAGVFSGYYWTWNKDTDIPNCLILSSTYRVFRYHLGSVALGSLLLATIRFIRIIIEYVDRKCKKYAGSAVSKSIMCVCRGFFWLLENFLKFLNTNAYIMMAIYGKGFFSSGKEAFFLLVRNMLRVAVIDQVADYLLLVGKLVVTILMGILSFYHFSERIEIYDFAPPMLNFTWVPIAAICMGTYLIASSFFAVYDMAVDTIFLCFLEDCEYNDGSAERPYYMSKELMRILHYKNKLKRKDEIEEQLQ